ncbi:MAG: anhydro-N-acetylmuramic acid kinase [Phycisphaerales bacterium]|jgi:anhydro-N-acetylmuramic acid kinase|nr:anhydro-N-acetylmuramic acid kinase [Phycisphaerales bacterium]
MANTRLIIGAMSGTSADGVDGALVEIKGEGRSMTARCLLHRHHPYAPAVRDAIFSIRQHDQTSLADLATLGQKISLSYASVARKILRAAKVDVQHIAAIAAHGQTLYHNPPNTIQWLDPALIAAEVGCAVVSDFRRADCAVGGQGAPLVPFADYVLFGSNKTNRILLNLGGIANLTYLRAGGDIDQVIAFDTGPANCISDGLCQRAFPGGALYDEGGKSARRGRVHQKLVKAVLSTPYFSKPPPKSTDIPAIRLVWYNMHRKAVTMPLDDALATACFITARSVADAIHNFLPHEPAELILSGGGSRNLTIVSMLQSLLNKNITLRTLDETGINSQSKEAVAFALLGAATLDGLPANVPSATGASRPVILGSITPRPATLSKSKKP